MFNSSKLKAKKKGGLEGERSLGCVDVVREQWHG